jgi:hypothetical protein
MDCVLGMLVEVVEHVVPMLAPSQLEILIKLQRVSSW